MTNPLGEESVRKSIRSPQITGVSRAHVGKQTGLTLFREADGESVGSEQESHLG